MQRMSDVMTYVTVLWLRSEQNIVWNKFALIKRTTVLFFYERDIKTIHSLRHWSSIYDVNNKFLERHYLSFSHLLLFYYYLLKKEATKLCTTFLMEKKGKHNYTTPFPAHRAGEAVLEAVLEAATNPLRLTTKWNESCLKPPPFLISIASTKLAASRGFKNQYEL